MLDIADNIKHIRNNKPKAISCRRDEPKNSVAAAITLLQQAQRNKDHQRKANLLKLAPTLHLYGGPDFIPEILDNFMREIYTIMTMNDNPSKCAPVLNFRLNYRKKPKFVNIPMAPTSMAMNVQYFKKWAKKIKWVDWILDSLTGTLVK